MENLFIAPTEESPEVSLNAEKNRLTLEGESHPEDIDKFFLPIFDWVDEFFKYKYWRDDAKNRYDIDITLDLKLTYFNSSSAKRILDLIGKITQLKKEETCFSIRWFFNPDDPDSEEAGRQFADLSGREFEFVSL